VPPAEGASSLTVPMGESRANKASLLAGTVVLVVAADLVTKAWIRSHMTLYQSIPVLGDFFRLTYTQNPGAAFGIHVGTHSRVVFLLLSICALAVLAYLYRVTSSDDRLRLWAVALVSAGAVGNIIDRLRFPRGVVDFLDVGLGPHRWPVFNVADMAVSTGAVLLLLSFYLEERRGSEDGGDEGA
jgi:signal peptidase II